VREINKINEAELALGTSASWHDEYKDSAYIYAGGLNTELTEGDVIAIFSQYGEILNINMPREKETGKPRGFAFLMYEDQRSTILAVDNLNGAKVLERTLRVDHVKNYKQPRKKNDETGEWDDADEEEFNARPEMIQGLSFTLLCPYEVEASESSNEDDGLPPIDPEDPMYDYLVEQRREAKALQKTKKHKTKSKSKKHPNETPEERAARKARKRAKKDAKRNGGKSENLRGVEAILRGFDALPPSRSAPRREESSRRSRSPRTRSTSPPPRRFHRSNSRTPPLRRYRSRSRTPPRYSGKDGGMDDDVEMRDRDYRRKY
ncbi:hypothetical protein DL96DRAFT_1456673, partial [Flagelloscypha sp. PMI_526]